MCARSFSKNNGSLGEPGSVGYLFEQRGLIIASGAEDEVLMAALDAGADDVVDVGDGEWEIVTVAGDLASVRASLEGRGITVESADVTQFPTMSVPLDVATAPKVLRLVDALEDLDDVQAVFANFDIPDEILAKVI